MSCGLTPSEYWAMSPRELGDFVAGVAVQRRQQHRDIVYGAWLTAAFERSKRLPGWKRIEARLENRSDRMTPEQMLHMVKAINAQLGGEDKTKGKT